MISYTSSSLRHYYFGLHNAIVSRGLKRPAINTSQLAEGRRTGALAMKVGMLAIYDKWGARIPVTVLQLDNCEVIQTKLPETDGYCALQLGVGESKVKNVNKPLLGHFNKAGVIPKRKVAEFRVTSDCVLNPGTRIRALHFVPGQLVDVQGTSKGKGFQGAMKRWGFSGNFATHGNSVSHRSLGSTGMRQDPGRVFKNKKMAGRMGGDTITVQNLKIVRIDPSRDLLYVKGACPGVNGGFVEIVDAVKGPFYPNPPPYPTYTKAETDADYPKGIIDAPISEKDAYVPVEPVDPY